MDERMIKFQESADYIKHRISEIPSIAIVLGSGLGKLADKIENPVVIPYGEIPNFKKSTAIGHKGNLIYGTLGGIFAAAIPAHLAHQTHYAHQTH